MRVAIGAKSDVGRVREGNEDSYLVDDPLFVVADGMGGHLAGDVASSTAVEVIAAAAQSEDGGDPDSLAVLVRDANEAIFKKAQADTALRGMGTTCTLLMIQDSRGHLAHVGDSRAYLLRDGELSQLTEDHSLVGRMVKEGRLTAQEAENHPQRSIITRALGVDSDVEVDLMTVELKGEDRILLCSDGLTSMVDDDRIKEVLGRTPDPQIAADELVSVANEAGGEDNVTVVIVDVGTAPPGAPPAPVTEESAGVGEGMVKAEGTRGSAVPEGDTVIGITGVDAPREDTPAPAPEQAPLADREVEAGPRRRSWKWRVVAPIIVVALLLGGGYAVLQYVIDNSFYVGLNESDVVTIYRGLPDPDEIFGLRLSDVEEETTIEVSELPDFQRDDVREARKFSSLDDARQYVDNLERSAEAVRRETNRRREKKS
ncbi:MAG: Stp1/IreP family PP2C-type Ser/Thr phosphatase [Actinomycetota bacterium]